jgi:hypothetical protein
MPFSMQEPISGHAEPLSRELPRLTPRRTKRWHIPHFWTDEELNTIAYLRNHNWTYINIQRRYFPSSNTISYRGKRRALANGFWILQSIKRGSRGQRRHSSALAFLVLARP